MSGGNKSSAGKELQNQDPSNSPFFGDDGRRGCRPLLSKEEIDALYQGSRYEDFKGREYLDNAPLVRRPNRSLITCTAAVCFAGARRKP